MVIFLQAFGDLEVGLEELPPIWHSQLACGLIALAHLATALILRAGARGSWGFAVCLLSLSMLGCVTAPFELYGIVLLFKPSVRRWLMGVQSASNTTPKKASEM